MSEQNELTYPYESHPAPGTTRELAEGVHWLTMPMPGSLSHINLYLIRDTDGWWVVDTGLSNEQTSAVWQEIFASALGGAPIVGVICTHMHPDHIGQAAMITEEFKCPLYMTRAEYYQARFFANSGGSHHTSWLGQLFYSQAGMPTDYLEPVSEGIYSAQQ